MRVHLLLILLFVGTALARARSKRQTEIGPRVDERPALWLQRMYQSIFRLWPYFKNIFRLLNHPTSIKIRLKAQDLTTEPPTPEDTAATLGRFHHNDLISTIISDLLRPIMIMLMTIFQFFKPILEIIYPFIKPILDIIRPIIRTQGVTIQEILFTLFRGVNMMMRIILHTFGGLVTLL
ncbi:uncharacterized protein LOC109611257 isoform X2 [Ooceraea biroi]|uniref:uncharacterized protein LOC109611257 isoform X2 n=1 Tax=Ooceraea biroi TaxID=2015173 RepID=UPI00097161ED|nr:uncharacterized protein LOC109611257 isoform X2 [Ooceraea biroi]